MKPATIIACAVLATAMAIPGGAFAASTCHCQHRASASRTAPMMASGRRIAHVDIREAESAKNWYSTFPTLGFYWGRMAPRNSRLF
jgi:hypothetical protein